jgi:hypothetical protein
VVQAVRAVDGVRVTKVAGVTCYSQLDDTEVDDALIALHKVVDVHFEVGGVTHVLESHHRGQAGRYLGACPLQLHHLRGDDGVEASAGSGGAV